MSLYGALNIGVAGLNANSQALSATSSNIANINTPNYRAQTVSFESALAASVQAGSGVVTPTQGLSLEPTQQDGNNVNLDTEDITNANTVLQYQFASQAIGQELTSIVPALTVS